MENKDHYTVRERNTINKIEEEFKPLKERMNKEGHIMSEQDNKELSMYFEALRTVQNGG